MQSPIGATGNAMRAERAYATLSTIAFRAVWLASRAAGTPRDELDARRGFLPPVEAPLLWFHGASAGELAAAEKLAALLRRAGYEFTAGYTAANGAGVARARRAAGGVASLAPWDSPRWVARALERWRPRALFLVETEIWPSLILEAARRGVPAFCVSARIYPKDMRRYALVRRFVGPLLGRLSAVLVQDEAERGRFLRLGADVARCLVAGNLKYLESSQAALDRAEAARAFGCEPGDRIVVVGSVHRDEVRRVLGALAPAVDEGARLIVAPRRANAGGAIASECRRRRWPFALRSAGAPADTWRVLVLDAIGELEHAYASADLAIVGGGFGSHGGHNPYEPVLAGAPVLIGPHFEHFGAEASRLVAAAPESLARDADELATRARELLRDKTRLGRLLGLQRTVLPDPAAITRAYLDAVAPALSAAGLEPRTPAALCRSLGR